jgi:hypothetical protein
LFGKSLSEIEIILSLPWLFSWEGDAGDHSTQATGAQRVKSSGFKGAVNSRGGLEEANSRSRRAHIHGSKSAVATKIRGRLEYSRYLKYGGKSGAPIRGREVLKAKLNVILKTKELFNSHFLINAFVGVCNEYTIS